MLGANICGSFLLAEAFIGTHTEEGMYREVTCEMELQLVIIIRGTLC